MKYCRHAIALKMGQKYFDGPIEQLTTQMLNQLYGSEADKSLFFSDLEGMKKQSEASQLNFMAA